MLLKQLRLHDFRNYAQLEFAPAPGLCVLVGENAAGKTNILESLFLCALGRSQRTRHDHELIRYGQPGAFVGITLSKSTGTHTIACKLQRDARRALTVDGMPLARSGELLGTLRVVMFSPEDLRLIKQGPSERRRFLDMELSQLYPAYYYALQQYNHALKQRNALLRADRFREEQLAPWDVLLARLGAQILAARSGFLEQLSGMAARLHASFSGGREALDVAYAPSLPPVANDQLEGALLEALSGSARKDRERGNTSIGPHRDDLVLLLNGEDVRAFGSQGQQRTAALSLKLSELELMKALGEETPVLLLDDVLSELDGARQRMLAAAMTDCQVFLTCTQLAGLEDTGLRDMTIYRVENAGIREEL